MTEVSFQNYILNEGPNWSCRCISYWIHTRPEKCAEQKFADHLYSM